MQKRCRYPTVNVGGDYTDEEQEFLQAMARYMKINQQPFPTFSEVLTVARSLGYRKVAEPYEPPGLKGLGRPPEEGVNGHSAK